MSIHNLGVGEVDNPPKEFVVWLRHLADFNRGTNTNMRRRDSSIRLQRVSDSQGHDRREGLPRPAWAKRASKDAK